MWQIIQTNMNSLVYNSILDKINMNSQENAKSRTVSKKTLGQIHRMELW